MVNGHPGDKKVQKLSAKYSQYKITNCEKYKKKSIC